jgi:hypothetical protein
MIEMGMSYHDPGDIHRSGSHSAEAIGQRLPSRPAIPARIDDDQVAPAEDDIGEGVTERTVRNWYRDRPQIRPDLLYRRKGPRKPRFPLGRPGHPHRLITIAPIGRRLPERGNWTQSGAEARITQVMVEDPVALVESKRSSRSLLIS